MAIFVDISGTFDNLWWPARRNIPNYLLAIIKSYLSDRKCPTHKPLK
jgi:hypothetical protein